VSGPGVLQEAQAPTDSLRAVLDSVFADPAYRWVDRPHPLAFLARWWDAARRWLLGLEQSQPTLYWLVVWLLIGVLVVIVVHAFWVMAETLRAAGAPAEGGTREATPEVRGAAWYRREARDLAREGRYPEAMQADFLGLVLELDQRRVLRFHPSKTPGEYTGEAQLGEPARSAFRDLVRSLYRYAFAREPCGPEDFAAWLERSGVDRYAAAH
jgi:Domain of unknown function (DUF4129)